MFVEPMELVFVLKIYLDPATLAFADDPDTRAEREPQLVLRRPRVNVFLRLLARLLGLRRFLDDEFGFAHREIARENVARHAHLRGFVSQCEQRARMTHR